MKRFLIAVALLSFLACPVLADDEAWMTGEIRDLLDSDLPLAGMEFRSIGQYPPPGGQYPPPGGHLPPPPGRQRLLFPGPKLFSVDFGLSFISLVGGGAADDSSPHLAVYREYWSAGGGLHADVHLRVLASADAYVGVSAIHHSSTGGQDYTITEGPNTIFIRYRFDPLYIFPLEVGGSIGPVDVEYEAGRNSQLPMSSRMKLTQTRRDKLANVLAILGGGMMVLSAFFRLYYGPWGTPISYYTLITHNLSFAGWPFLLSAWPIVLGLLEVGGGCGRLRGWSVAWQAFLIGVLLLTVAGVYSIYVSTIPLILFAAS